MLDDLDLLFDEDDDVDREVLLRPPLNYRGSKFESLPELLPLLPYTGEWCDVFGGSGVVTLNRKKQKFEVYNDKHSGLIAFYKCVINDNTRRQLKELIELLPHSRELFIDCKDTWEKDKDDIVRAAKYYYSVRCSFSGREGHFGRTVQKETTSIYSRIAADLELFPMLASRFKGVQIENVSWERCLKDFDSPSMVFYLDPPYIDANCYRHNMTKDDHIRLCKTIFNCQGFVALSGYDNNIYNSFDWSGKHAWHVSNKTQGGGALAGTMGREDRVECLWIKEA